MSMADKHKKLPTTIVMTVNREPLMKGKAQYSWPPRTNLFRLTAFENASIIYFATKQTSLMRRPTVLSHPLQWVFPAVGHCNKGGHYILGYFLAGKAPSSLFWS